MDGKLRNNIASKIWTSKKEKENEESQMLKKKLRK
jgi:hypothetical protein